MKLTKKWVIHCLWNDPLKNCYYYRQTTEIFIEWNISEGIRDTTLTLILHKMYYFIINSTCTKCVSMDPWPNMMKFKRIANTPFKHEIVVQFHQMFFVPTLTSEFFLINQKLIYHVYIVNIGILKTPYLL